MLAAARRGELVPWPHRTPPPAPDAELALGSGDCGEPAEPRPEPEPLPPALVAIIDRATAATPAERYPDARSMLEELDAFIVADRAARKAESPARQLAAWLAAVWDGARDDLESDAAVHAEHLVSFLDDGAVDVAGTGTMRSLAATAAEDVQGEPPAAPAPAAPPPAPPPAIARPKVIVAPDTAPAAAPGVEPPPAASAPTPPRGRRAPRPPCRGSRRAPPRWPRGRFTPSRPRPTSRPTSRPIAPGTARRARCPRR